MRNPAQEAHLAKPTRNIMVFIDGDNLVFRYQEMLKKGYVPRDDMLVHEQDVFVWSPTFTHLAKNHEILRLTYYTYVTGDDHKVEAVRESMRSQKFNKHMAPLMPNSVTPCVFKKNKKSASGKGVDIQMCVDILSHVYRGNTDAIHIMSGDGDFEPLINEVLRAGVQVFLSAFSDGLNPKLKQIVDGFYCLDGTTWKEMPEKSNVI